MENIVEILNEQLESIEESYIPQYGHSLIMLDVEEKDVELLAGMYPRGKVSALVAEGGVGKTWTLVASSLSISSGIAFLPTDNYEICDNKRVLLIDTEGRVKTFVRRIDLLGGSRNNYVTAKNPLEIPIFSNEEDRNTIELVVEHEKIDLIIIDSFAGFSNVDENTCQVLECLQWLSKIALKYDCAIVFTQLINKGELKEGRITTKSVRGFSGITQWCELIWAVDCPTASDELKRLYQIKNNISKKDEKDYIFELKEEGLITWKDYTDQNKSKKRSRQEILREYYHLTNIQIAKLIQEQEPNLKIKSLEMWVSRNRELTK